MLGCFYLCKKAIDWTLAIGTAFFVEPSEDPSPVTTGIILKKNVSLIGLNGPVPRGTKYPLKAQPVGSVFAIHDTIHPFITVGIHKSGDNSKNPNRMSAQGSIITNTGFNINSIGD